MKELPRHLKEVCIDNETKSNSYEIKSDLSEITEPIFLRHDIILSKKVLNPLSLLSLFWLTISQCVVKFININFKCKIQVTAKSQIFAENCTFTPYDSRCECSIEIFANSSAVFHNCHFTGSNKAAIAVRDRSIATISKCTFENSSNSSVLVIDKSRANIYGCTFKSADRFSVYLYRKSITDIKDSHFLEQKGKAVFMLSECQASIKNCIFNKCMGGAISFAESTECFVDLCSFFDLGSSSIHAMKNSVANVKRSFFKKCNGNGVNFEYSNGFVYRCIFNNFTFPVIACFGPKANPVIYNSVIKNCKSFAIVSRDCASPIFSNLRIFNVKSHGFSISDFSEPLIENCILKKIQKIPFCVYNGATSIIKNCLIKFQNRENNCLFKTFTDGNVIFNNNSIFSNALKLFVFSNYFGQVDIAQFLYNFLIYKTEYENKKLKISEGKMLTIDENKNIKIDEDITKLNENRIFKYTEEEEENEIQQNENETFDFSKEEEEEEEKIKNENENENEKFRNNELQLKYTFINQPTKRHANSDPILLPSTPAKLAIIPAPLKLPKPLPELNVSEIMQKKCHNHCHCHHNDFDDHDENVDASTIGHQNLGICLRCKENLADHVIVPCGHKVLCKKCSDECTSQNGDVKIDHFCPLCDVPISKCTEEFVERKCVICLENDCDTIILPCGHRCICYECATHLWTEKKQCPLCQTRVLTFRHMFNIYTDEKKE